MGQKTHPVGFRIGITKNWSSRWFSRKGYAKLLEEDIKIRRYLTERLKDAMTSSIEIERKPKRIKIIVISARPGVIIGKKGAEVDKLKEEIKHLINSDVHLDVREVLMPELDASLIAQSIAHQIEKRIAYRRAMKRAVQNAMNLQAKGIRVQCAGRLAGAEIARREWYRVGSVPLHTLKADIDYATATAITKSGTIGIKVWINKPEEK